MRILVTFVLFAVIFICTASLVVSAIARVRDAAARTTCQNNLKQIGLALYSYEGFKRQFPQAADPNSGPSPEKRWSWLATLAPYFESTDYYVRAEFRKGWAAEENRYLAVVALPWVQCPEFPEHSPASTLAPSHYVGITGLGVDAAALATGSGNAGFFGYGRKLTMSDIHDHASSLLVALETTRTSGAWTGGGTGTARSVEEDRPCLGFDGQFGGIHRDGANALFADGHVRHLRNSMRSETVQSMATILGSKKRGPFREE